MESGKGLEKQDIEEEAAEIPAAARMETRTRTIKRTSRYGNNIFDV